jgi:hypothetical protein
MIDYTTGLNRSLVLETFEDFAENGLMDLPDSALTYIAEYPDMLKCSEQ